MWNGDVVVVALVALGIQACGTDEPPAGVSSSTVASTSGAGGDGGTAGMGGEGNSGGRGGASGGGGIGADGGGGAGATGGGGAGTGGASAGGGGAGGAGGVGAGGMGGATTGTGGGGGMGAGGGPMVCTPALSVACYTGPPQTVGVGDCSYGQMTCNADGTAWGPCIGEIVPQQETCTTPGDEDCDGLANEDGDGCVCVPGSTETCYSGPSGTLGIGTCSAGTRTCDISGTEFGPCVGEVVPALEECMSTADEDCDGAAPACTGCSIRFDGSGLTSGQQVAFDPAGNAVVVGYFEGTLDLGGNLLASATQAAFVAKFDSSCGPVWSKALPATTKSVAIDVAVDSAGSILVTGNFQGTIDFGGATLAATGYDDGYLVKLDGNGVHQWSKRFGDTGADQAGRSLTTNASGDVAITGAINGSANFGGGVVTGAWFLASFASNGTHLWSKATNGGSGGELSFAESGDLVLAGVVSSTVDWGGGPITNVGSGNDVVILEFSPGGAPLWNRTLVTSTQSVGGAIVVGGDVFVTGHFAGSLDAGGGNVLPSGDIFVVRLDGSTGTTSWAKAFGANGFTTSDSLAAYSNGGVGLVGSFGGALDFGGGSLPYTQSNDVYIARLTGAGAHVASASFGGGGAQFAEGIAISGLGQRAVVGAFEFTIDFGFGPLTASSQDGYLVLFNP